MARIISIATQKGGVGKTTTTVTLAHALSKLKKKVLVIDLDPQANSSLILGLEHPDSLKVTVADLFLKQNILAKDCVQQTKYKNIDYIPSNINLFSCSDSLSTSNFAIILTLKKKLDKTTLDTYDFILLDCPPNLGGAFVINAMVVSDYYILPIESGSLFALTGVDQFMSAIDAMKEVAKDKMQMLGVVLTRYDSRTTASKAVEDLTLERFGKLVFKTRIRKSTTIEQAALMQKTVIDMDSGAPTAKDYMALAKEVLARCEGK